MSETTEIDIRKAFKDKYLTDAFFFVENEDQFYTLQDIAVEFGLKNPVGDTSRIKYDMHDVSTAIAPTRGVKVVKNLTFFPNNRFQESSFWVRGASYGEPKDYDKFMADYAELTTPHKAS